jgi:hypothetical protein
VNLCTSMYFNESIGRNYGCKKLGGARGIDFNLALMNLCTSFLGIFCHKVHMFIKLRKVEGEL